MDYLEALRRPVIELVIDEETYTARKASLRQFWSLLNIQHKVSDDATRIIEYVACALSVEVDLVGSWFALDVARAYEDLLMLNAPQDIQLDHVQQNGQGDNAYGYDNRALAVIVVRLASAFGWSRDYILDELTYDEARCYLQELAIVEHSEKEFDYSLSQIAYSTRDGKRRDFPALPIPKQIPQPILAAPTPPPFKYDSGVAGVIITYDSYKESEDGSTEA